MNVKKAIKKELKRARELHPVQYKDIIHRVAVIAEESGEAVQATLNYVYHGGDRDLIDKEVIQCLVTCQRFLERR